ncbi:MAG: RNA methyltransferase [Caldisericia bacterium]
MKALVLIHYPVLDRKNEIQASSVTPFDIHDLARSSRTFGIDRFYITHPAPLQRGIVERILGFWNVGGGKTWNPHRSHALELCRITPNFDLAIEDFTKTAAGKPHIIGTSAKRNENSISFGDFRKMELENIMIILGTGWGLTDETMKRCDYILNPICGPTEFNHLSVRAAGAIILDRLYGLRDE